MYRFVLKQKEEEEEEEENTIDHCFPLNRNRSKLY
jgi:hypothetical protein